MGSRADLAPLRTSQVEIQIGGRTYPAKQSNQCGVCRHPARVLIEEQLILNETYTSVSEWVSNLDVVQDDGTHVHYPNLTVAQLRNHFNRGHCPLDTQALHKITEQVMDQMSAPYEEAAGRIVEPLILAKLTMVKTQEMLAKGDLVPTLREGLAAAKLVHDIERDLIPTEMERLQLYADAVKVYFAAVKKRVSKETWTAIADDLSASTELKAIEAQLDQLDVVDAELVEE